MQATKQLAKNTFFLYLRMFFMMGIALYTSRLLLNELGIDDFGLYGVVTGILGLFVSVKALFSSATQRFVNVEIGKGNMLGVRQIFNMSVIIHMVIALLFFVVLEGVGPYIISNYLNIPIGRLDAAIMAFHIATITSVVVIVGIPLESMIFAYQKMDFYAVISILDSVLKLIGIFLLEYFNYDKLILYVILLLGISILLLIISQVYCHFRIKECRYQYYWNKDQFKELASFSGWNFFGTTTYSLVHEGINILLNIFGGVTLNASRAIAYQVNSITRFMSIIHMAISPYGIQLYSRREYDKFFELVSFASKIIVFVFISLAIPVFIFTEKILLLWLNEVPIYSVGLVRAILIYSFVWSMRPMIVLMFNADGKIKLYKVTEMFFSILSIPINYISLKYGLPYWIVFIDLALLDLMSFVVILFVARSVLGLDLKNYIISALFPVIKVLILLSGVLIMIFQLCNSTLFEFILIILFTVSIVVYVGFNQKEKKSIYSFISGYSSNIFRNRRIK